MTNQDRRKLKVLIVLLVILGVTLYAAYRINRPSSAATVQAPESRPATAAPTPNDARIRLDMMERSEESQDIGRNNVFQYRLGRPAFPAEPGMPPAPTMPPSALGSFPNPPIALPPPIPLKYQGFAEVNSNSGRLTAFLSNDTHHFNATAGEVLMGRYRILRITDATVEVEDLEHNRRQILPLLK